VFAHAIFLCPFSWKSAHVYNFASVLEEFACLPEFVLVSTIVLIGSI
jgi:hypothetical protein